MWLSKLGGSVASRALRADSFAGQPERAQHGTSFAPMLHVQNALKMAKSCCLAGCACAALHDPLGAKTTGESAECVLPAPGLPVSLMRDKYKGW